MLGHLHGIRGPGQVPGVAWPYNLLESRGKGVRIMAEPSAVSPIAADPLIDATVRLASELQVRATALQSPAERRQQAELDRMLRNPADKATLVQLTDQAFRSQTAARTAEQFTYILDVQGIPRFFSPLDKALLRGFQTF